MPTDPDVPAQDLTGAGASRWPRSGLDPALHSALAAEGERLRSMSDPVSVLRSSTEFFAVLDQEVADLVGVVRMRAITDLRRQGWSHQQIADACGLTRQRVSQLIHEADNRP